MEITHLGHSSFRIKGKNAILVVDPFHGEQTGLKFPKNVVADVVTVSHNHQGHNAVEAVDGSPFCINGPGEYEVKGIGILGFPTYHDTEKGAKLGKNTVYHIEVDGIDILHLGDLGELPSTKDVESFGNVDILIIPVGGTFTIDASSAAKLVAEIEPKVVIPMHYQVEGMNAAVYKDLAPVSAFLKELGKEAVVAVPKYVTTKDKLPVAMEVVVLE
jgi:L-ascorbate metabolism protein UlaG (beta-lactamase superfamily)